MGKITRFEELRAWSQARILTRDIYAATSLQPFERDFALRDQIRRAAISAVSNVVEGYERRRPAEFIHFLIIARASVGEVKAQLYVALDVGHISAEQFDVLYEQADLTSKMIHGLTRYLKRRNGDHNGRTPRP